MTQHTPECEERHRRYNARLAEVAAANAAWAAKWPNYCRHCSGYGGGDGEPCGYCTEQGKCPRCGQAGVNEANGWVGCDLCGWRAPEFGGGEAGVDAAWPVPEPPYGADMCPCEEREAREYRESRRRAGLDAGGDDEDYAAGDLAYDADRERRSGRSRF